MKYLTLYENFHDDNEDNEDRKPKFKFDKKTIDLVNSFMDKEMTIKDYMIKHKFEYSRNYVADFQRPGYWKITDRILVGPNWDVVKRTTPDDLPEHLEKEYEYLLRFKDFDSVEDYLKALDKYTTIKKFKI